MAYADTHLNGPWICKKCGSPLCGSCGQCIEETHPRNERGTITEFGIDCPFVKREKNRDEKAK
jgi:hypothetical protein